MICPVCNTKIEKESEGYCLNCAWEFEYYFDELSDDERKRYLNRLQIAQLNYKRSINNEEIKDLESIHKLKSNGINEPPKQTYIKDKEENRSVVRAIAWVFISALLIFISVVIFDGNNISFLGEYNDDISGFIVGTFISILIFLYLYIKNNIFSSVETSIYWIGISISMIYSSIMIFDVLGIQLLGTIPDELNGLAVGSSISLFLGLLMFLKRMKIRENSLGSFLQWLTFSVLLTILSWILSIYMFHFTYDATAMIGYYYIFTEYKEIGIGIGVIISILIGLIVFFKRRKNEKRRSE